MTEKFKRALLLEDELALADAIGIALKKLGVPYVHATTLAKARAELDDGSGFDLLILDRMLPDGDGLELCRESRTRGFVGAILLLTAKGELESRVEGLEGGADDYLPKPFAFAELQARLLALARRHFSPRVQAQASQPGLWQRDTTRLRILGPKGWVELTPLEFKLVEFLIDAQGTIVSRDDLLKNVWGFTLLPKTRTVDHFLGRLRKLFEENAEEPRHFLTVRGAGYRFEP